MPMGFLERAHASDRLIATVRSAGMLANPTLHPLREHPGLQPPVQTLGGMARVNRSTRLLHDWLAQILCGLSRLRSSRSLILAALPERDARNPASVLFVSHRLPGRDGFSGHDRYFGVAPTSLDSVVLLIDHRPIVTRLLSRREVAPGRITLPQSLGLRGELRILVQSIFGAVQLLSMRRTARDASQRELITEAFACSGRAATGLRIAQFVAAACHELQPEAIVVTYEGHPWERLVFHAARSAAPGIVALGYPHVGILPGVHSLFRMLGADLDPDGLLAPGELARRQIERRLPGVPVELLGSPRRLEVAGPLTNREPICIVFLEGMLSEDARLTRLALELAQVRPDVKFRLRPHHTAVMGDSRSRALMSAVMETPNVHLSDAPFADDAGRATWCLYRGSTAAVMAVAAGVTPLYLHVEGEAIIDPLGVDAEGRARSDHFVVDVSSGSDKLRRQELAEGPGHAALAAQYFTELTPHAMPRLIDRIRQVGTDGQSID